MESFYYDFLSKAPGFALFLPFFIASIIFALSYLWLWKRSKPREKVMAAR